MAGRATRRQLCSLVLAVAPVRALVGDRNAIVTQDVGPAEPDPGATPDPGIDAGSGGEERGYLIAFLNPYPESTFWQVAQQAIEDRAQETGIEVVAYGLASPSAPEQVAQFEAAVARGADGIVVGVVDPIGAVPGIVRANEAGIPVLAIETAPAGGDVVSLVRTDDVAAARAAGAFLANAIDGSGIVLNLQGDMAHRVAQDRDQGLREAFAVFTAIEVISESAGWSEPEAYAITAEFVPSLVAGSPAADEAEPRPSRPLPRAIFGANDLMTRGAVAAVADAARTGIVIAGFGSVLDGAEAVASGQLAAVVAPFPARMGTLSVDLMIRHLNGEAIPTRVDAGYLVVTADNAEELLTDDAS